MFCNTPNGELPCFRVPCSRAVEIPNPEIITRKIIYQNSFQTLDLYIWVQNLIIWSSLFGREADAYFVFLYQYSNPWNDCYLILLFSLSRNILKNSRLKSNFFQMVLSHFSFYVIVQQMCLTVRELLSIKKAKQFSINMLFSCKSHFCTLFFTSLLSWFTMLYIPNSPQITPNMILVFRKLFP